MNHFPRLNPLPLNPEINSRIIFNDFAHCHLASTQTITFSSLFEPVMRCPR
jgi:hypothetical protein